MIPQQSIAPLAVSPEEAGRLIGMGRTRVFEAMRTGDLPSFKIGRTRRIRMDDLRQFVDKLMQQGRSAA